MPHQPYFRIIDGADTAILFVHGIVGTPDQFSALLPLVPQEWSCVNLLLPGHGGSVSDFSHTSMARLHVKKLLSFSSLRSNSSFMRMENLHGQRSLAGL